MEFSVENMCRACMNDEGSMYSVYTKDKSQETNLKYSEMIMNFTSIQIEQEDGLPQRICQYCLKQLIAAFTFKQTIERSDATLREITKNPTTEIEFIKEEVVDIGDEIKQEIAEIEEEIDDKKEDFKLTAEFLEDDFTIEDVEIKAPTLKVKPQRLKKPDVDFTPLRKQYVCPLCSKHFAKLETFRKHKKIHKVLKCELCGREFRSPHGLRYHMKVHSGVKNYACTFANCDKKFRLKQALDKHLSIHNNEKNHLCPICGKTYAQYDALHYHIRNHTGERPYLCVHCGKTFKQSCHLKNHMWNHTGIKPYKCKSCGKCYTTGHQLKKHLRKYCNNPVNQSNQSNNGASDEIVHFQIEEHEEENSIELETTEDTSNNTIYIKI